MTKGPHRILMSNLGYARGIDGRLFHHVTRAHRHVYSRKAVQQAVLQQFKEMVTKEQPDLCCLLEIDSGSLTSGGYNQLHALIDDQYRFCDIETKYAPGSKLRKRPLTRGKSNGFIARHEYAYEKLYFSCGTKRLIYRVRLEPELHVYFTHFSLNREVRRKQLREMIDLIDHTPGETLLLGDFNILGGLDEIHHLLDPRPLVLLNDPAQHTFRFHRKKLLLDLCICSQSLAARTTLDIIPQPFSDHAALVIDIRQ